MKRSRLVPTIFFATLVLAFGTLFLTRPKPLPLLGPAPAWKMKDVNGVAVSSDQFKGKVVVVDFWATWCPPCREEIPAYIDLVKKYGKYDLVIVGVDYQEDPKVVKAFMQKNALNYPVVMGDDDTTELFGGVEALPTTFIIDRSGQIRDRKVGDVPMGDYKRKILSLVPGLWPAVLRFFGV